MMQVHIAVYHSDAASKAQQGDDLSSDLGRLLEQGALSDVVLQAQGAKASRVELRAHKADGNLLLLKTEFGAGHGGMSGRYQALKDVALEYAFVLKGFQMATR